MHVQVDDGGCVARPHFSVGAQGVLDLSPLFWILFQFFIYLSVLFDREDRRPSFDS